MIPRIISSILVTWLIAITVLASPPPPVSRGPTDGVEYITLDPASVSAARSTGHGGRVCTRLAVRREWRDLSPKNKRDYIQGMKCLQGLRSHNRTFPRKFTRYDDFVYGHSNVADSVHNVGQFLPWHRHFDFLFERELRQRCHYRGPFPYWDWTRDTNGSLPISQSPIFDPVTGFGGDGVPGTYTPPTDDDGALNPLFPEAYKGCIQTGPFANTTFHHGPNLRFTDHCLVRGFREDLRSMLTPQNVANIMAQTTFLEFWRNLDNENPTAPSHLHGAGHQTIGGDFTSFYSSPNDPLFYLHHAGLDRLWWNWVKADLPTRLYQIGGRLRVAPPFGEVTLDYEMPFAALGPPVTLRKAMDLRLEPYCYTYQN